MSYYLFHLHTHMLHVLSLSVTIPFTGTPDLQRSISRLPKQDVSFNNLLNNALFVLYYNVHAILQSCLKNIYK